MSKIKILAFHHSGAIGGGSISMLDILRVINKDKYDIKVYCPYERGDMYNAIKDLGFDVDGSFDKRWIYPHFNGRVMKIFDPRLFNSVKHIKNSHQIVFDILKKEAPQILILNSMTLFWIGSIAKSLGIKTICFYRETLPDKTKIRNNLITQALREDCDAICFLSQYDCDVVGAEDKSYVIHDKVDIQSLSNLSKEKMIKSLGLSQNDKHILYMGGMWPLKGIDVITSAMKDIDAKLIVLQYVPENYSKIRLKDRAGAKGKIRYLLGMDYEAKVVNKIHKNKLWEKIIFLPAQNNVERFFAVSDVVVFPSRAPHQARPLYEAGIARCPVVISDFENTNEFAINDFNVLTSKAGDSNDLANKINRLLQDKNSAKKLTDNNFDKSTKDHNIDDLEKEITDVLDSVMA